MDSYQQDALFQPATSLKSAPIHHPLFYLSDSHRSITSNSSSSPFSYHTFRHLASLTERPPTTPASHAHPPTSSGRYSQLADSISATVTEATALSLPASHSLQGIWALPLAQVRSCAVGKEIVDLIVEVQSNVQPDQGSLHQGVEETLEICTATQYGKIPPGYPLFRCKYHCPGTCCSNYVRSAKAACGDCMVS